MAIRHGPEHQDHPRHRRGDRHADEVVARLAAGEDEIAYGTAQQRAAAAHAAFDEAFARMNG